MSSIAFSIWMFLVLLMGWALYKLWGRLLGHRLVDWLLLPGTIVSELAYSNGLLLLGRPAAGGIISTTNNSYAPGQVPTGRYAFLVSAFASLITLAGGCVALGLVAKWLGRDVLTNFVLFGNSTLPGEIPHDFGFFTKQFQLVSFTVQTLGQQDWLDWRTPMFLYLTICLAVRLGTVRHDWRTGLLTAAVVLAAMCGLENFGFDIQNSLDRVWPLLTFVWLLLIMMLAVTLVLQGAIDFVHIIRGEVSADTKSHRSSAKTATG